MTTVSSQVLPKFTISSGFGRAVPLILQAEATECGLACLAMVSGYHGMRYDVSALRSKFSSSMRGITLAQLMQMASELRLSPRALRLELAALKDVSLPCILHWNLDHFVVLEKVRGARASIVDPAVGRRTLTLDELSKHFSGIALEAVPSENFEIGEERSALKLSHFFRSVHGLSGALSKLFMLSLVMQTLVLLMPFYGQIVIDQVISSRDLDLLAVLAMAFGMLTILHIAITTVRAFFVAHLGATLQFGWAIRLFYHLIRLPLGYFEKRSLADVLSRFKSLATIQRLASNTIVETVMDGLLTLTTFFVMVAYSPQLTIIPALALILYIIIRSATFRLQRENVQDALLSSARENSHFLESLRGILAIKSFSREFVRESTWQNRAAEAVHANLKAALYDTSILLANQLILGLEGALILWLGANLVIEGGFSVGMLVAYLAYKVQFTGRASALVDKMMEFGLASVHLDRLSDIALAEEEVSQPKGITPNREIVGEVRVRDVCYRYSQADPWVLRDATFFARAGECVAMQAPSGSGKTTLIKILMGLLKPESGEVLVDGVSLSQLNVCEYREQIAAVMQEDSLLSGTLLDNIAFFDPKVDRERVEMAARVAAVHRDIVNMPMGYYTLVGDMGAALSGGQRQRVLLARALYRSPRILLLDEATSHIDPETEAAIYKKLAELKITRVVVSHRPETLALADRVVQWNDVCAGDRVRLDEADLSHLVQRV